MITDAEEHRDKSGRRQVIVHGVKWRCPDCGFEFTEQQMRNAKQMYVARNPKALFNGIRSFFINAFTSPWIGWNDIMREWMEAKGNPEREMVVVNTRFGESYHEQGAFEDETIFLRRREAYGAELPDGVLLLTAAVDTQDNRLEYEVVGHGKGGATWGIKKGYIMGRPDTEEVWERLDDVIDHVYHYNSGKGLRISITCVDSGGHFTQEVYAQCRKRLTKRVFAIKGKGGEGIPFISPPSRVAIKDNKKITCWLYTIGVDAGKSAIMSALKVMDSDGETKFCHFPLGEERGYDANFFNGLLSERMVLSRTRRGNRWAWEKLPGHERNEALDCRNYAMAGFRISDPDLDAIERRLKGLDEPKRREPAPKPKRKKRRDLYDGDW